MIVNLTPHPITFVYDPRNPDGGTFEVPSAGIVNAAIVEAVVDVVDNIVDSPNCTHDSHCACNGWGCSLTRKVTLVKVEFQTTPEGDALVNRYYGRGDILVGSLIAAQAYPGRVMAMVAAPGYERVPPDKKRMRPDRFMVF